MVRLCILDDIENININKVNSIGLSCGQITRIGARNQICTHIFTNKITIRSNLACLLNMGTVLYVNATIYICKQCGCNMGICNIT